MNDSCSDSETGKEMFNQLKSESNLFLNIKEEPDGSDQLFKSDDSQIIHQHPIGKTQFTQSWTVGWMQIFSGLESSGKFHNTYVGFPFSNLDSTQISMLMSPPPAHKNVVTHGVHLDINPIDRLYSMQNSYFCTEETPIID